MQSSPGKPNLKFILKFKKKEKEPESSSLDSFDDHAQEPIDTSSSMRDEESREEKGCRGESHEKPLEHPVNDESYEKTSDQLVHEANEKISEQLVDHEPNEKTPDQLVHEANEKVSEQLVDHEPNEKTSDQSVDAESNDKHLKGSVNDEFKDETSEQSIDESNDDYSKQLVVYDPLINGGGQIVPVLDPTESQHSPFVRHHFSNQPPKVLPSVGAFTVQCANCFKWRLIPTKERYEKIRERILQIPFYCETAREWRPNISCDDPEDISQDGSRLWAIDKPNIAQPPPGWQRLLRIRGEGGTKFADVYYVAPTGKRLRSMVEVQKYLMEHPEYTADGVTMSQFSFQIPRPLQENYVRKRPARGPVSYDGSRPFEAVEVRPISWAAPEDCTELQLGMPGLSSSSFRSSSPDHFPMPKKKKKKKPKMPLPEHMYHTNQPYHQHSFGLGEPGQF